MTGHAFAFRAPWYVRERANIGLLDPQALGPAIQMYDSPRFVQQVTQDPRDSLRFTKFDRWSYPVPVALAKRKSGRKRFATHRLIYTGLRKLYQPNHDRFYLVVAELFCDEPGLPRAGPHRDVTVRFVMRRRNVAVSGAKGPVRRLARELMLDLLKEQHGDESPADNPVEDATDLADLWWADMATRDRFTQSHADLLDAVTAQVDIQAWLVDTATGTGKWAALTEQSATEVEQTFPMWRLPDRPEACEAAHTRSLWFGLVPTYSADHWLDPDPAAHGRPVPKLDDHAIYELVCSVTQPRPAGQEHCPPQIWWSAPTEPFRLAAAYDPEGTKNRQVSITAPDFRALAARAGQPAGPGGLAINTPPGSHMKFNPFDGIPKPGSGRKGGGPAVCTFAFELFFIVALFLFLMFLPIVVFAFQLWWMLALRFCFLRLDARFNALTAFFAKADVTVSVLGQLQGSLDWEVRGAAALDAIMGVTAPPGTAQNVVAASLKDSPLFAARHDSAVDLQDLVTAVDPKYAVAPTPPAKAAKPKDPLCRGQ